LDPDPALRDRWLEQANADASLLAARGKYEVARVIEYQPNPSACREDAAARPRLLEAA
jgi:hypothetical protein